MKIKPFYFELPMSFDVTNSNFNTIMDRVLFQTSKDVEFLKVSRKRNIKILL